MRAPCKWVVGILGLALLPMAPVGAQEVVKFGIMDAMTGRNAKVGQNIKRGAEMAAQRLNARGGVLKRQVVLVVEDDKADPSAGVTAMEKLVTRERVHVVTGLYSTGVAYAALNSLLRHPEKPVVVALGAIGMNIDQNFGKYDWFFHLASYADDLQRQVAEFYGSLTPKPKRIALAADDSLVGQSVVASTRRFLKEAGFELVADETFKAGASDLTPVLTKIKAADPEIFHLVAYQSDLILATKQMQELRFMPRLFGGPPAAATASYLQAVGAAATEGVVAYTPYSLEVRFPASKKYPALLPSTEQWIADYKKAYGADPDPESLWAYTVVVTTALAMEEAGSVETDKVIRALERLDVETPMGRLTWTPRSQTKHQGFHQGMIEQWQKGRLVVVYPGSLRTAPPLFPVPSWDARK
ncbi:MAG: amino acid ABC transporter substrate-binding protein [candidate division NC10 bacterium]